MFARMATRTGVQLPSPPAFALRHEKRRLSRRSETKADLSLRRFLRASKTTVWQASLVCSRSLAVSNTMKDFYYVYSLVRAINERAHYSGITRNLKARLIEHNRGKCPHTSKHRPWYIEVAVAFRSEAKARRFERYLKTGSGREFARRDF
jgi:putative endonuclease